MADAVPSIGLLTASVVEPEAPEQADADAAGDGAAAGDFGPDDEWEGVDEAAPTDGVATGVAAATDGV